MLVRVINLQVHVEQLLGGEVAEDHLEAGVVAQVGNLRLLLAGEVLEVSF